MGNLLGSPVTDKETHTGRSPDGSLLYGVSSMQGWRVHMEDAHICRPTIYAEERIKSAAQEGTSFVRSKTNVNMKHRKRHNDIDVMSADYLDEPTIHYKKAVDDDDIDVSSTDHNDTMTGDSKVAEPQYMSNCYKRISLPNHSLFAVFDGHGGSFAAQYAGLHFFRVLSRQPSFVQYAHHIAATLQDSTTATTASVETFAEQQRRLSSSENTQTFPSSLHPETNHSRKGVELLEQALRDAFVELDREIFLIVRDYHEKAVNYSDFGNDRNVTDAVHDDVTMEDGSQENYGEYTYDDKNSLHPHSNGFDSSAYDEDDEEMEPFGKTTFSSNGPVPKHDEDSGTTALVVVVTPNYIVCANAGDSRAIYSKNRHNAVPLSSDHKPDDEAEKQRIRHAGGSVHGGRVEGDLAVSRGLGDFRFKDPEIVLVGADGFNKADNDSLSSASSSASSFSYNTLDGPSSQGSSRANTQQIDSRKIKRKSPEHQMVSPVPDITVQSRNEEQDEFIVLACDGIWDVCNNQECVSMIAKIFHEGESNMGLLCEEVLDMCLSKGSKDNMTVTVVRMNAQSVGLGGGVTLRREQRSAATGSRTKNYQGDY